MHILPRSISSSARSNYYCNHSHTHSCFAIPPLPFLSSRNYIDLEQLAEGCRQVVQVPHYFDQDLTAVRIMLTRQTNMYLHIPVKTSENCSSYSNIFHREYITKLKRHLHLLSCQKLKVHSSNLIKLYFILLCLAQTLLSLIYTDQQSSFLST